jgi:outer membrane immunogenic protein
MYKMLCSAAALAVLCATSAMAADLPVKAPVYKAPPPPPAAYNWSGFYTASEIGGAWASVDGTYVLPPTDGHSADLSRAVYGTYVGAQYQWNNWVLGVEGGWNTIFTGHDWGHTASLTGDCLASGPAGFACRDRVNNYWTVGGKLGYAFGNWLVYAVGGFANGRIQTETVDATGVAFDFTSERHDGWYAGGGVDMFVTKIWWSDLIIGAQYRHVDLGTVRHFDLVTPPFGVVNASTRDMSATVDTVVLRATFKYSSLPFIGGSPGY